MNGDSGRRVVVIGNLTIDDVVQADGTTSMAQPGGNAIFACLGARLWNPCVGVVMRRGPDLPAEVLTTLQKLHVDLDGVRAVEAPTSRAWLLYEQDGSRRFISRSPDDSRGDAVVRADDVPSQWLLTPQSPVVHIAPMRLSAAAELVESIRRQAFGAVLVWDPHETAVADRAGVLDVARHVDVFAPSRAELTELVGYDDPRCAVDELHGAGVASVVAKLGADGCLVRVNDGIHAVPAYPTKAVDPTGAGDTFCGALAGAIAARYDLLEAVQRANATASWSLETSGSLALASLDSEAAQQRFRLHAGPNSVDEENKGGRSHRSSS